MEFVVKEVSSVDVAVSPIEKFREYLATQGMTVYRVLTLLEEAGMIRKVARQNDRDVYEHDYGYAQHDHFICEKCGELIEFSNEKIRDLVEEIAAEYGFRLQNHRLEGHGICEKCSTPPQRRHRKLDMI
jgi:Fur family ferric uptake transcriptional regulator